MSHEGGSEGIEGDPVADGDGGQGDRGRREMGCARQAATLEIPEEAIDGEFALCLTHDVDRPFKRSHQALYYAVRERRLHHLRTLLTGENPYWQFDEVMTLEEALGVRSAFYFLSSPALWSRAGGRLPTPGRVVEHLGRYDPREPAVAEVIRRLEAGGWEIGLHASIGAATDRRRLALELARLSSVTRRPVVGCRQHHLKTVLPDTLLHQSAVGLEYDSSFGTSSDVGFQAGGRLWRPVPGGPIEFPMTAMEIALPDPDRSPEAAWSVCERLLETAREEGGVMTVLWHLRYFSEREFPGYRSLYRRLVKRALEMGAWVGPPRDLLEQVSEWVDPATDETEPRAGSNGEEPDTRGDTAGSRRLESGGLERLDELWS